MRRSQCDGGHALLSPPYGPRATKRARTSAPPSPPGGAPAGGWTLYAPLTLQMGPGMDMAIFAIHLMGASSIMGSINIIVTILNMRAPGMTLMKMPMFCWTWLITAYLFLKQTAKYKKNNALNLFDLINTNYHLLK